MENPCISIGAPCPPGFDEVMSIDPSKTDPIMGLSTVILWRRIYHNIMQRITIATKPEIIPPSSGKELQYYGADLVYVFINDAGEIEIKEVQDFKTVKKHSVILQPSTPLDEYILYDGSKDGIEELIKYMGKGPLAILASVYNSDYPVVFLSLNEAVQKFSKVADQYYFENNNLYKVLDVKTTEEITINTDKKEIIEKTIVQ